MPAAQPLLSGERCLTAIPGSSFCNQRKCRAHLLSGSREAFSIAVATPLEANHCSLSRRFIRMSDWNEMWIRRDSALKRKAQPDSVRRSDEELTKAKSRAFWRGLMYQLDEDINKLNQECADDDKYQAHFTELNRNAFEITNCLRPYKTIVGRLNETNLCAELEIRTGVDNETLAEKSSKEIKFVLTSQRDVYAQYMGTKHILATSLCQTLLQELLDVEL